MANYHTRQGELLTRSVRKSRSFNRHDRRALTKLHPAPLAKERGRAEIDDSQNDEELFGLLPLKQYVVGNARSLSERFGQVLIEAVSDDIRFDDIDSLGENGSEAPGIHIDIQKTNYERQARLWRRAWQTDYFRETLRGDLHRWDRVLRSNAEAFTTAQLLEARTLFRLKWMCILKNFSQVVDKYPYNYIAIYDQLGKTGLDLALEATCYNPQGILALCDYAEDQLTLGE